MATNKLKTRRFDNLQYTIYNTRYNIHNIRMQTELEMENSDVNRMRRRIK